MYAITYICQVRRPVCHHAHPLRQQGVAHRHPGPDCHQGHVHLQLLDHRQGRQGPEMVGLLILILCLSFCYTELCPSGLGRPWQEGQLHLQEGHLHLQGRPVWSLIILQLAMQVLTIPLRRLRGQVHQRFTAKTPAGPSSYCNSASYRLCMPYATSWLFLYSWNRYFP